VQALGAQQHDGLQIHPHIRPLGQAQVAVDVAEQGSRRAEAVPVRDRGPLTGLQVLARNAIGTAVALLGLVSLIPCRALAWHGPGHMTVAKIAFEELKASDP
jgi:hypothetical protein